MSSNEDLLGSFQCMFLCMVIELGDQVYGLKVTAALEKRLKKKLNVGQIYMTGTRLYKAGIIGKNTGFGESRSREVFVLTPKGKAMLEKSVVYWKDVIALYDDLTRIVP